METSATRQKFQVARQSNMYKKHRKVRLFGRENHDFQAAKCHHSSQPSSVTGWLPASAFAYSTCRSCAGTVVLYNEAAIPKVSVHSLSVFTSEKGPLTNLLDFIGWCRSQLLSFGEYNIIITKRKEGLKIKCWKPELAFNRYKWIQRVNSTLILFIYLLLPHGGSATRRKRNVTLQSC